MVEFNSSDPTTYEEAENSLKWREAMDDEMHSIEKNQTWELSVLPNEAKCIGVKWIYKTKLNENGEVSQQIQGTLGSQGVLPRARSKLH